MYICLQLEICLINLEKSSSNKCNNYILLTQTEKKTVCTVKPLVLSLFQPQFIRSWWPINHLEPQTEKENPHVNSTPTFPVAMLWFYQEVC